MISRCYLEITNICNLSCRFCPKTCRSPRRMTMEEFDSLTDSLKGQINFLYFHLMGEPLLHPDLPMFISMAKEKGFVPILTTNGTLFDKDCSRLLSAPLYKAQISLHAHEGNNRDALDDYIRHIMEYAMEAATQGTIIVLRLWNQGGYDSCNAEILRMLEEYIPQPWTERYDGFRLADRIYLEYDGIFEWPDAQGKEREEESFCYALRNQIGVLVDGTVVPCCLDHNGDIPLGNLHHEPLQEILSSERAQRMYDGFSRHQAVEHLCRNCGYASVAKRFRKS